MREIKFRAWDNTTYRGDTSVAAEMIYDVLVGSEGYYIDDYGFESDVPVMQYTGLKDKNGMEIYEGDIVVGFGTNGVVEWFDDLTWDDDGSHHPGFYCKEWCEYKEDGELSFHYGFNDCEVIGNIYENKELL